MAAITVTVEIAFDGTNFIDISNRATNVRIKYGRRRALNDFTTGTSSISIWNGDNYLTPGHSDSTYGNTQLISREVRISSTVTGGSDSYPTYLWRGFISDVDYSAGQNTSTVVIRTIDGFQRLAQSKIVNQSFAQAYTGVRISEILNLSSVNYPNGTNPTDRSIDLGSIEASATSSNVTQTALDYCQQLARTENGRFLVNHAGTPSSTNKGGILSFFEINNATEAGITISDAVTLPTGSVEAAKLNLDWGSEQLFNSYQFTAADDSLQTGSTSSSITKYGERVVTRTLLSDATAADEAGTYFIYLHQEPSLRASSVIVDIDSATTADAETILHCHVMSALALNYLPPGSSQTLSGNYVIEGVDLNITVRDMASNSARIRATYNTAAADSGFWILGDAVLGSLPTILGPSWLVTGGFRLDDPQRGLIPVTL